MFLKLCMFTVQFLYTMKFNRLFLLILFVITGLEASAQSYYLMPEKFFLQKGDKLNVHLMTSEDFTKQADTKYQAAKTGNFTLYEGKKKIDLKGVATPTDSVAPIVSYTTNEEGLIMISMGSSPAANEMSRSKFLRTLDESDPDNIAEKVKNSNQLYYKEKYTNYMKTLVVVNKPSGSMFDKPLNEDYEIVLQENPYKFNYGDDISALILFKGKPIANAVVTLIVKTVGGNVFPEKLSSDATGLIYFKLSREGIYVLTTSHAEQSKDKTADFESWRATFTFAFSSNNDLPNTYKEFGFGNKH
jgi:Domain of unknown function (DUF4198)